MGLNITDDETADKVLTGSPLALLLGLLGSGKLATLVTTIVLTAAVSVVVTILVTKWLG